jgi:hypothetical protein
VVANGLFESADLIDKSDRHTRRWVVAGSRCKLACGAAARGGRLDGDAIKRNIAMQSRVT